MSWRSSDRLRPARLAAVAGLLALAFSSLSLATTSAAFTGRATATVTIGTRAACPTTAPAAAAIAAQSPTAWWRYGVTGAPASVPDSSGNGNAATVVNAGLTFGTANTGLIACDTTYAMRAPGTLGARGFTVLRTARTAPSAFTVVAWLRSSSVRGGRLVGFGDSSTAGSTTSDRALLLDTGGHLVFYLRTTTGTLTLTSAASVATNTTHQVAASVGGGTASLYVDGTRVATALVVSPPLGYTGYWRTGWDQGTAAIVPGVRDQAAAVVDEVAVWEGRSLSGTEIAALVAANHW